MREENSRRLPEDLVRQKHDRIVGGQSPRTVDLFAGCGGLSLGFDAAGFRTIAAVEFDPHAARSHALNFFGGEPDWFEAHARPIDITKMEPADLFRGLGISGRVDAQVDVIVGGPPCQAFARVGRAKLREVADHPEAFLKDPRGNLYLRYLHYVNKLKPIALLMENVPDVLNYGGHNIAEETCETLVGMGYACGYTLLNSVYFGVPQMRERMFLIAIAEQLVDRITFPQPTHWVSMPRGYEGTRQVALQTVRFDDLFGTPAFFVAPPSVDPASCEAAVTAKQALCDLPPITEHLSGELKRGARRFDTLARYREEEPNDYAKHMRTWPGFERDDGVLDHAIRSLSPRDQGIFRVMESGDQYPEAHARAIALFEEKIADLRRQTGKALTERSKAYKELWSATVPPYDPGKFPNKWRKMEPDAPVRTLMAHLGKDSYSHIHYDSRQARTISVREAARLQSFPDGFMLSGTMNPAFRQIGNAVPPLMAQALADHIRQLLTSNVTQARPEATENV